MEIAKATTQSTQNKLCYQGEQRICKEFTPGWIRSWMHSIFNDSMKYHDYLQRNCWGWRQCRFNENGIVVIEYYPSSMFLKTKSDG
ncbi:hypothetical protein GLOIN_2v1778072 [Rhizophagus irregularis DAOM 181602=DAOM 197198]|nr:hypothetical protein GLOIN_2v1778072 [Rhizophagus irregularis DAOM 181602=DAOM 197198]